MKETLITIRPKFFNFADVFFLELKIKLDKHTGIHNLAINLIEGKLLYCKLIYSLKPVELGTLRIYNKTELGNRFIELFKSVLYALILFDQKPKESIFL